MTFMIMDREGCLHYDGPPPNGKPLVFETADKARAHLESGNWHLDGAEVVSSEYVQTVGRTKRQGTDKKGGPMGIEYAIVHDTTKEAYDLGKGGLWASWKQTVPTSRHVVAEHLEAGTKAGWEFGTEEERLAYLESIGAEIWAFIESHPGCRVVSDTEDDFWTKVPDFSLAEDGYRVYRQVGSRYRENGNG